MLIYYLATFVVAVVGGFVQLNRETFDQRRLLSELCPCFSAWRSLDVRWALLKAACTAAAYNLSWATLSAACAAVGGVLGWFFGYTYLRVPLDEIYFDQAIHNNAHHGCVQGARALVPVYRRGSDDDRPEKWCPTRARVSCATVHWVNGGGS